MDKGRARSEERQYGVLRKRHSMLPDKLKGVIDWSRACGWHECNESYFIRRDRVCEFLNDYLMILTLEGEGVGICEGVEYRLTRNKVIIFSKNVSHAYFVPKGCRWEFYWMHMDGPNCEALLNYLIREHGVCFEVSCLQEVSDIFERLLGAEYRYYEYEFFAAQMIVKLLFTVAGSVGTPNREAQYRKMLAVDVIDYIEAHFGEEIQLSDLSAQMKLSPEHAIRLFSRETGMTPYQYLKQYRLRKACSWLEESEWSIAEVAAAVGYRSVSAFIAQFKEYYGITPGAYRRYFRHADATKLTEEKRT